MRIIKSIWISNEVMTFLNAECLFSLVRSAKKSKFYYIFLRWTVITQQSFLGLVNVMEFSSYDSFLIAQTRNKASYYTMSRVFPIKNVERTDL